MDSRLLVARGSISSSTVGFLDLENRRVAIGTSFLCAIELEICLESVTFLFNVNLVATLIATSFCALIDTKIVF